MSNITNFVLLLIVIKSVIKIIYIKYNQSFYYKNNIYKLCTQDNEKELVIEFVTSSIKY